MKRTRYRLIIFFAAIAAMGAFACKPATNKFTSPQGYNLNSPEKFIMPEDLLEISGIAFQGMNGKTVYSIQDEDGKLFAQNWGIKKATAVKFASKGDYEDVAIYKQTVFVLKSSGSLFVFPLADINKKKSLSVREWKKILPKGEYESMYIDEPTHKIYILGKNNTDDHKARVSTGYIYNYDPATGNIAFSSNFSIKSKEIEAMGQEIRTGLKASAMTLNPVTKEWYVLSSVNKILVIVGADWKVKAVHRLDSSIFNQPEGMAFDNQRNLYISNEGDELSNGNILKFKFKPSSK
ncbi:SdiA-regulated domain-containing protein [Pedobacter duraquae]|uniref:SdiA-regulated protein n=1 Tax=Pedobacter duraquae TaxID=425511 RepID=A0A4R6IL38_9SPHI|nr:SdiA-regulated domain-containing protein [Pedobacter duraquae]TDO22802.1 SdiA-regulated protein [Pedobacter duraquae]